MIDHGGLNRTLWVLTGTLSLLAAIWGVLSPQIYGGLNDEQVRAGAYSQDLISVAAALALIGPAIAARDGRAKLQIVAIGLLGYLFSPLVSIRSSGSTTSCT